MIPAGGLLEVVSVDPNEAGGYDAFFASDLPFGSYYVKERTTNSAYILSDTEYPVVFEYAGQEAALVQILVNEGEAVSNDLLRGRVDGVKYGENPGGRRSCEAVRHGHGPVSAGYRRIYGGKRAAYCHHRRGW